MSMKKNVVLGLVIVLTANLLLTGCATKLPMNNIPVDQRATLIVSTYFSVRSFSDTKVNWKGTPWGKVAVPIPSGLHSMSLSYNNNHILISDRFQFNFKAGKTYQLIRTATNALRIEEVNE